MVRSIIEKQKSFFFQLLNKNGVFWQQSCVLDKTPKLHDILCLLVVMDPAKGPLKHYLVSGSLN